MAGTGTKEIKHRIKSVESTSQITKAMELVASSKLKKAKERAGKSAPYFEILKSTIRDIGAMNSEFDSVYTEQREIKSSLFIVIAGDRGLAGGYNANVFRAANELFDGKNVSVIPIGKKACEYYSKRGFPIVSSFEGIGEYIDFELSADIAKAALDEYLAGRADEIYVIYTKFVSPLTQKTEYEKLIPFSDGSDGKGKAPSQLTLYEPSAQAVFDSIIPDYVSGFVLGAVIESFASEQGARRTAMESANDNAEQMIEELKLSFNRARQGAITQELTEIVSGAASSKS